MFEYFLNNFPPCKHKIVIIFPTICISCVSCFLIILPSFVFCIIKQIILYFWYNSTFLLCTLIIPGYVTGNVNFCGFVRRSSYIGLKILIVSIAFYNVTGMKIMYTSMYLIPFSVLLKLAPLYSIWVSDNNVFAYYPNIFASFAQTIMVVSSGKSMAVNPV